MVTSSGELRWSAITPVETSIEAMLGSLDAKVTKLGIAIVFVQLVPSEKVASTDADIEV